MGSLVKKINVYIKEKAKQNRSKCFLMQSLIYFDILFSRKSKTKRKGKRTFNRRRRKK